jgi:hypothetical protein
MRFAAPRFVTVDGRRLAYEEVEIAERFNDDLLAFLAPG